LTAVASKGVPSVKTTPVRRVNVQLIPSGDSCQAVASDGWILPLSSILASDSTTMLTMFPMVAVVPRIGSRVSASTPMATVSMSVCREVDATETPLEPQAATIVPASTTRPSNPRRRVIPIPL